MIIFLSPFEFLGKLIEPETIKIEGKLEREDSESVVVRCPREHLRDGMIVRYNSNQLRVKKDDIYLMIR